MSENEKTKDEAPEEEATPPEETTEETPEEDNGEVVAEAGEPEEVPEDAPVEEPPVAAVDEDKEEKESGYQKVASLTGHQLKQDIPDFRPGDSVKVHVKIIEGNKERVQVFEGVVIAIKHGGLDRTFTVRKTSWGVGVERTFFIHSPKIGRIEVTRRGRVRRAKLYYLRQRAGKSARIKERRIIRK